MRNERAELETIFRSAVSRGNNHLPLTLVWGGRHYAIKEVKQLQKQQKGETILYSLTASDGQSNFKLLLCVE